ncbi:PRTRC system protein A [Janthinobacterium sp. NKUCC06_STL]|jgi:PRTRC genetic system protein A|uniref:PRTRC system protein A n=1 Tax=Janthinobacterium sp. NKUCC06_STL TaxID=2842127 RepID=UPI001C5AE79F|nr:PRTRC system protein A [Janthinobacterium sp. NKUCC06_STL]MBW3512035.1 PRTRC system protein A [Janthinobacterium sp. NKUCC06_STL]
MLDPRDIALQAACPVVAAPRFGQLATMDAGQRIVLAANGVFVEVKLSWLSCLVRVGSTHRKLALPYGDVQERVEFAFGMIPRRLVTAFVEEGRRRLPNELAGGLIYSSKSGLLRLRLFEEQYVDQCRVDYRMPALASDEVLAVDLHTHGGAPAYFSSDDDHDDKGFKVAGVFGNLDAVNPSARFRLVIGGFFVPLPNPWERDTACLQEPCVAGK